MKNIIGSIIVGAISLGVFLFLVLLGTLTGAFTGWIVGWFFSEAILGFLATLGIKGMTMWQVGAALGFVGGFFTRNIAISFVGWFFNGKIAKALQHTNPPSEG